MIKVADLTRKVSRMGIFHSHGPRTVLHWAENTEIFKDKGYSFRITFLNKCDDLEKKILPEYYQRCFMKICLNLYKHYPIKWKIKREN